MLARVGCQGYRAFQEETQLNLNHLTVIFGKNNSGKTTLTRLPLFIRSSMADPHFYALHDEGLRYGASFRDLTNLSDPHPTLSYSLETTDRLNWAVELQSVSSGFEEEIQVTRVKFNDREVIFRVGESIDSSGTTRLVGGELLDPPAEMTVLKDQLLELLKDAVHVPSARPNILPVYEARPEASVSASEAPYLLHTFPVLVADVSEWLETMLEGLTLDIEHSDYAFRLVTATPTGIVNFASTGQGSQALLPLVILVKAIERGLIKPGLLVVEEPEAHLHPSAHRAVAELLVSASAHTQVLTETHSENFMLRIRRMVAQEELRHDSVNLIYVGEDQKTTEIGVDATGSVTDWPEGVFEYDIEEARAIVEARLRRIQG